MDAMKNIFSIILTIKICKPHHTNFFPTDLVSQNRLKSLDLESVSAKYQT